ncbi:hypothetical protein BN1723_001000, partial [Verticillium longisporum]
ARLFHDFSDTRNSSNCVFAFDSVTKLHTYQQPTEAPLEACLQRATIASSNESRSHSASTPAPRLRDPSIEPRESSPSAHPATAVLHKTANMTKPNDTIAIIVIVLFVVLALVAFGIYRLVHQARRSMSVTSGSSGSSSELAD